MMDFTLIAVLGVCFLLALLVVYTFTKGRGENKVVKSDNEVVKPGSRKAAKIHNWNRAPADKQMGDLGLLSKHGSIHEYLLHIHDHGRIPMTVFWWGPQKVVSVCGPDLFKDIVKYTSRPKMFFELVEPMVTPHSLMYSNGLDWEERRKVLYPTLRDGFLKGYVPHFIEIANETVAAWSQLSPDTEVVLQEEFFTMTIKGIARSCFGGTFNNEKELRKLSNTFRAAWVEMEQRIHLGPPEPGSEREQSLNNSLDSIRKLVMSVVKGRKDGTDTNEIPFIDALLQSGVSDPQIFADSITFMAGGFHTSGYLLVWSMYYMSLHPEVMEKLVLEMKEQVGSNRGEKLVEYVYSTTTYLRKVIDETLRMSIIVPYTARSTDHDIVVGGYCIPAGTPIMNALGVSLKNECVWKNTNEFDPEHFGSSGLQSKDAMAFCPFGIGRRKCPGYVFAQIELSIFLTILLQQFTLKPVGGVIKPVKPIYGLVTSLSEPLCYTVHPIA